MYSPASDVSDSMYSPASDVTRERATSCCLGVCNSFGRPLKELKNQFVSCYKAISILS